MTSLSATRKNLIFLQHLKSNTILTYAMIYLFIISFLLFVSYNVLFVRYKGLPTCLSDTFYMFKSSRSWLFPVTLSVCIFTAVPAWIHVSKDIFTVLPFIACFGVLLVAAAPYYKSITNRPHVFGAAIAGLATLAWTILHMPWMVLLLLLFIYPIYRYRSCYLYFLELWAFSMVYFSTFTLYLI